MGWLAAAALLASFAHGRAVGSEPDLRTLPITFRTPEGSPLLGCAEAARHIKQVRFRLEDAQARLIEEGQASCLERLLVPAGAHGLELRVEARDARGYVRWRGRCPIYESGVCIVDALPRGLEGEAPVYAVEQRRGKPELVPVDGGIGIGKPRGWQLECRTLPDPNFSRCRVEFVRGNETLRLRLLASPGLASHLPVGESCRRELLGSGVWAEREATLERLTCGAGRRRAGRVHVWLTARVDESHMLVLSYTGPGGRRHTTPPEFALLARHVEISGRVGLNVPGLE